MSEAEAPEIPETIEEFKKHALAHQESLAQQLRELTEKYNTLESRYDEKSQALDEKSQAYDEKVAEYLEVYEKYKILQSAFFGRSSEKWSPDDKYQASLFNEAEIASDESGFAPHDEEEVSTFTVARKRRGKRKPIPDSIPRYEVIIDIPEDEKFVDAVATVSEQVRKSVKK